MAENSENDANEPIITTVLKDAHSRVTLCLLKQHQDPRPWPQEQMSHMEGAPTQQAEQLLF